VDSVLEDEQGIGVCAYQTWRHNEYREGDLEEVYQMKILTLQHVMVIWSYYGIDIELEPSMLNMALRKKKDKY